MGDLATSRYDNRAMILLQIGSFLSQTVQVGAFPLILTKRLLELESNSQTIGHISSVSWVFVLILGPFVPKILRCLKTSASNSLTLMITLIALFMLYIAHDLAMLFLSASLMGCALILRWILCDVMIVERAPKPAIGRLIGIHEALMGFGIACGPLIVFFSYPQWTIIVCGILMLVSGLLLLSVSKAKVTHEPAQNTLDTPQHAHKATFKQVLIIPLAAIAVLASVAGGFIEASTNSLFPVAANMAEIEFSWALILVSIFGFGGTLLQPVLGWLADLKGYFYAQMACLISIIALSILVFLAPNYPIVLAFIMFFLGGSAGGLNTLAVIQFGQTQSDKLMPTAMTLIAMTYTTGSVLGPNISGIMIDTFRFSGISISFISISIFIISIIILNIKNNNSRHFQ